MLRKLINFFKNIFDNEREVTVSKPELTIPSRDPVDSEKWWVTMNLPQMVPGVDMWEGVKDCEWIKFMAQYYGEKEFAGTSKNNPKITQFFKWVKGQLYPDETMWCMAAVMGSLKQTGYKYLPSLWALDAEKVGKPCGHKPGCIATKYSKAANSKRHVFFAIYYTPDGKYVWGFGGNQSNMFCLQKFAVSDLRSETWPEKA